MELVSSFSAIIYLLLIPVLSFCGLLLIFHKTTRLKKRYSPFTENSLRLPGHTLRRKLTDLSSTVLDVMYIHIATGFVAVLLFLFLDHPILPLCMVVLVVCMLYQLYRAWQLLEKHKAVRLGLEGEEYIGQELYFLMRSGAHVFHDIPFKYGNIDHIVVGNDVVFVVETKAVSKAVVKNIKNGKESKSAKVRYDGKQLIFPHFRSSKPIEQVLLGAEHVRKVLNEKCDSSLKVRPVVALPGWFIENEVKNGELLVISGKRGKPLCSWLSNSSVSTERSKAAKHIEAVARSAPQRSKINDPNASDDYDFWFNPKFKESSLS